MSNPTISDVHIDAALSNVSSAILQQPNAFIADKVFPKVPVQHRSNKYFTYPRGFFNRSEASKRAPGTEAAEKDYSITTDTYACEEYAIKHKIPDQVRANTDPAINLDAESATLVTHDLLIQRDVTWGAEYFTTGKWSTDITGAASGSVGTDEVVYWSDETNGTPISDIDAGMTSVQGNTGYRPNKLILGREVFDVIKRHPEFLDLINGGATTAQPALYTRQKMAEVLELDEVLVWDAVQNTANEGQTASHSFIGGKNALLVYAPNTPSLMQASAGYTFSWDRYEGFDVSVRTYREEKIKSDWVEGEISYDMKLVAADLGYFFNSIIL